MQGSTMSPQVRSQMQDMKQVIEELQDEVVSLTQISTDQRQLFDKK